MKTRGIFNKNFIIIGNKTCFNYFKQELLQDLIENFNPKNQKSF
jgi:hypothetical protein